MIDADFRDDQWRMLPADLSAGNFDLVRAFGHERLFLRAAGDTVFV